MVKVQKVTELRAFTGTWYPLKAVHLGRAFAQVESRLHSKKSPHLLAVLKGRESAKKLEGLKQIDLTIGTGYGYQTHSVERLSW